MFNRFKFGKSGDKEQPDAEDIDNLVADASTQNEEKLQLDTISTDSEELKLNEDKPKEVSSDDPKEENINIFDDFSLDEDLQNDVNEFNKEKNRDSYDYLSFVSGTLTYINLAVFLVIVTVFTYIFIQKDQDIYNVSWLDPVCNFILRDVPVGDYAYCSSITHMSKVYQTKLENIRNDQYTKILSIITDVYKKYDFINSKEVVFLVNKNENRLKPSVILEAFHKIKDEFSPIDKELISCSTVTIDSDNVMTIECEARSSSWNVDIKGYKGLEGEKVNGTSISIASSFFNFIEIESEEFTLLNSPKELRIREIELSESGYDRKTDFTLKLKYNTDNISL